MIMKSIFIPPASTSEFWDALTSPMFFKGGFQAYERVDSVAKFLHIIQRKGVFVVAFFGRIVYQMRRRAIFFFFFPFVSGSRR